MKQLCASAGLLANKYKPIEEIREALRELQRQTVQEPGCIRFEVLQHRDSPQNFTLWEIWINDDALDSHMNAPHTCAYLERELTKVVYFERLDCLSLDKPGAGETV